MSTPVPRRLAHALHSRPVRFPFRLYIRAREFACGDDITDVSVRAEVHRRTGAVTELVVEIHGSDYTEYLTDDQVRELEDEARDRAGEIY